MSVLVTDNAAAFSPAALGQTWRAAVHRRHRCLCPFPCGRWHLFYVSAVPLKMLQPLFLMGVQSLFLALDWRNQIDAGMFEPQMISQQLGCYRAVIFAGNQNIFISHLPAGITDISFGSLDDVLKRKTFVDRHQLGSELRLGCVQRNCQIDRQSQLRQLFDTLDNTAGRKSSCSGNSYTAYFPDAGTAVRR